MLESYGISGVLLTSSRKAFSGYDTQIYAVPNGQLPPVNKLDEGSVSSCVSLSVCPQVRGFHVTMHWTSPRTNRPRCTGPRPLLQTWDLTVQGPLALSPG